MGSRHSGSDANLRQPLYVEDADQNSGHQMQIGNERWKPINTSQRVLPKQTRKFLNGFHSGQVPATKSFGSVRHVNYRDSKSAPLVNGHKIWTPKSKPEYEAEGADERETVGREQAEDVDLPVKTKVIIGSVSVALGDGNVHPQHANMRHDNFQEKLVKPDSSREAVKLWRPVSRHGNGDSATARSDTTDAKIKGVPTVAANQTSPGMDRPAPGAMEDGGAQSLKNSEVVHPGGDFSEPRLFSREVAEAFLAQRWKEAMAADHLKLVLSPETDTLDSHETLER